MVIFIGLMIGILGNKIDKSLQEAISIASTHLPSATRIETTPEIIIDWISTAKKYNIYSMIVAGVKELLKYPVTIELAKKYLGDLAKELKELKSRGKIKAKKKLFEKSCEVLVQQFKDIRAVFTGTMDGEGKTGKKKKDEFLDLPWKAIKAWVSSPHLIIDSENSVYYFLMLWITKEKDRAKHFDKIIDHIRFHNMKKHYLLDIVAHSVEYLTEPTTKTKLRQKRTEALMYPLCPKHPKQLSQSLPPQRVLLPDNDKVMIKCVFQEVSKWEETGKYYSSPVLIHGYEFYYFLQRQQIRSENPPSYGMAGFLRCSGTLIPPQHYLPIAYSVTIQTPRHENRERKFSTMKVIFEAPEKAIGGKLTMGDERWEDVISGKSVLVNMNTITIIVSIEFLLTDESCLSMQDTEPSDSSTQRIY